jgi:hypothetical protein
MGADLILAWAPAPVNLSEESKADCLRRVKVLTDDDLEDAVENAWGAEITDIYDDGDPYGECREAIVEAIEVLWANDNRNLYHFPDGILGGKPCWVAGGTSWGDSFEEMDQLSLVYGAGLLDVFA